MLSLKQTVVLNGVPRMKLLVLPCDGIGPEISQSTTEFAMTAAEKVGLEVEFHEDDVGFSSLEKYGTTLRDTLLESAIHDFDGVILGPQSHLDYPPVAEGGRNVSGGFRIGLDLYANIRPAISRPFLPNKASGMDLVIYRENTEGFYPDRNMYQGVGEMMPDPDIALSIRKITRRCCMRICKQAFLAAASRGKKIAAVHKANSFLMTDGLFLECFREVAREFPDIETEELIVDAFAALLVRQPEKYDIVVTTNFYGDILSDLASELSGSLGLAGSINANAEKGLCMAQAQHGSAPDIAGQDRANPCSLMLSVAMMFEWIGRSKNNEKAIEAAVLMTEAIDSVLKNQSQRTPDLGGGLGTQEFTRCLISAL